MRIGQTCFSPWARNIVFLFLGLVLSAALLARNSWRDILQEQLNQTIPHIQTTKIDSAVGIRLADYPQSPHLPVQFLRRYIEQHGQSTLQKEVGSEVISSRKYSVAYYWCPQRAGNILHSFFNSIVWSMIHNRTVLWKYYNTSNQEKDCQEILRRANWLPSYDEWRVKLELDDPTPIANDAKRWEQEQLHKVVLYPQIPDVLVHDKSIVRNSWSDHPLKKKKYGDYLKQLLPAEKNASDILYAEGMNFLYGMLYSEIFALRRHTTRIIAHGNSTLLEQEEADNTDYSLAIHSRHTVGADDGSFVPNEVDCLNKLLPERTSCRVYLMSDRQETIDLLATFLLSRNCTVAIASHDSGQGDVQEHGPWAGAGFLEDLDVCADARDGFIGDPRRSSTALLIELIEYRRRTASYSKSKDKLASCKLPNKSLSGYDYGPGTPTFRHHSHLQPLAPIQAIESHVNVLGNGPMITASIDLSMPSPDAVYTVLNSFIYSVIANVTFALRTQADDDDVCDGNGSLSLKSWIESTDFDKNNEVDPFGNWTTNIEDNKLPLGSVLNDTWHYSGADWESLLKRQKPAIENHSAISTMERLYSLGPAVLYGLVFHQIFSICPAKEIQEKPEADDVPSLVLHLDADLPSQTEKIRGCIDSVFHSNKTSIFGNPDHGACHVFVVSDSVSIGDTSISPMIEIIDGNTKRIRVNSDRACSFSFFSFAGTDGVDPIHNLSRTCWRVIGDASKARAGWVSRSTDQGEASTKMVDFCLGILRERLEYKRHLETWKQGREPFKISPLSVCHY